MVELVTLSLPPIRFVSREPSQLPGLTPRAHRHGLRCLVSCPTRRVSNPCWRQAMSRRAPAATNTGSSSRPEGAAALNWNVTCSEVHSARASRSITRLKQPGLRASLSQSRDCCPHRCSLRVPHRGALRACSRWRAAGHAGRQRRARSPPPRASVHRRRPQCPGHAG